MRRDSFLHEVEDGLEHVAKVADRVEHYAHEVEKGAQFGRHLVQEIDDEYGAELQRRPSSRKAPAAPAGYDDKQALSQSSTSASARRGAQDPKHLLAEVRTATTLNVAIPAALRTPEFLRTLIQPIIVPYRFRQHRTRLTSSCMISRRSPSCATS